MKKKILLIAGSDSCAGAGIQADLKTVTCLGGYGLTVITALTAQNPWEVRAISQVSPDFVASQLDTLLDEIKVDAVKTGMLPTRECIQVVADRIKQAGVNKTVIDPVVVAASGARLIDQQALEALVAELFPLAGLVTPNLNEASLLSGIKISSPRHMRQSAEIIKKMGPEAVLVKGGHLQSDTALDLLLDESGFHEFTARRVNSSMVHGTGCTLASSIATLWAQEESLVRAVQKAKSFLTVAIQHGISLGRPPGTPDQTYHLDLRGAVERL